MRIPYSVFVFVCVCVWITDRMVLPLLFSVSPWLHVVTDPHVFDQVVEFMLSIVCTHITIHVQCIQCSVV